MSDPTRTCPSANASPASRADRARRAMEVHRHRSDGAAVEFLRRHGCWNKEPQQ